MFFPKAEIAKALKRGDFFPVFQPIVELRTRQVAGFEVLARWNHTRHGVLNPVDFIPAVEKNGVINGMTIALLQQAFACPDLANGAFMLSINLSAIQLHAADLPAQIADLAEEACFPLDRLMIEITESALIGDLRDALKFVAHLRALHCKVALDDFGTGYSSLQHLQSFPFEELKVDGSFVSSMTSRRESRKIVAEVLTVAEGVETQEQATMLHRLGCDLGQGWLYGKPVAAAELSSVIAQHQVISVSKGSIAGEDPDLISLEALPGHRLAQLQAIYDGAPVGLCFLDRNLRYVSLNKRLAQLNGIPAFEHIGKHVSEVLPQCFKGIESLLHRALEGEPLNGVAIEKTLREGGEALLRVSFQPARDEAGEIIGISIAVMDETHVKQTETALQEAEDHYRHMMQLNPHVPWVLDRQGGVIDASDRWEEFTGQQHPDFLGDGWLKVLHPDDVEHTREAIRHTIESGQAIDIRYRVCRPDGGWKWMRSRGSPRFAPTGGIVGIYGVAEPDEVAQASEDLLRCHLELQAAVEEVPLGIVLADAIDGNLVVVNTRAYELYRGRVFPGQKLVEYAKLAIFNLDGSPIRIEETPLIQAIQFGQTIERRHILFNRCNGTHTQFVVSARPVHAHDGQRIGAMVILQESLG